MCDKFPCQIQGGGANTRWGASTFKWVKGTNDVPIEHLLDDISSGKPSPLSDFKVTNGGAKKKKKKKGTP